MTEKVPLLIVPLGLSKRINKPLIGLSSKIIKLVPGIKYDLEQTDLHMDSKEYISHCLVTSLSIMFFMWSLLAILLYKIREFSMDRALVLGFALGFAFFSMFMLILIRYPKIIAGKKAEQVDKNLIFGLKDLLMQINSGVSLYNALVNVANSHYGTVSDEFNKVAQGVNSGVSMKDALDKMAQDSHSEYLRRTVWQVVNTIKAGASIKGALKTIIDELVVAQHSKIKSYSQELNLWSLIYMLFAVAIPTIGGTMLVILSSFAGIGVTRGVFILFLCVNFFIQYALIGLVKNRRPVVHL